MLLALVYYALQWSQVQTVLSQKLAKSLSEKLGSIVTIGSVKVNWMDDITLEDVVIKDLDNRDMVFVREVYVNFKSNLDFNREEIISFNNNLDFVMLNEPSVKLTREEDGRLNMDLWLQKVRSLGKKKEESIQGKSQSFTIDEAVIQNGDFELVDDRKDRFPSELFDYYNFKIDRIHGNLKDFYVLADTIKFEASKVKGIEKRSGLDIKYINTDFFYSRDQMLMSKLDAKINDSYISNFLGFYYDGPSAFTRFNDEVLIKASLRGSRLSTDDLGRFSNNMYQYKDFYNINADVSGLVKDLDVKNMKLQFGKGSYFNGDMHFVGLPAVNTTEYDFNLANSRILASDTRNYAGEKNYQKYVAKFGQVDFDGIFQGFFDDFYTDATINSTGMGFAQGKLKFSLDPKDDKPIYNGDLTTKNLNLAELTNNKTLLDDISFKGQIAGEGTTLGNAAVQVNGFVDQIDFNGYEYQNITLNGVLLQSKFDGYIKVEDENLETEIEGKIDFNKERNQFIIDGKVAKANLKALGYLNDPYFLSTNFNFDFDGNEIDDWLGKAQFTKTFIEGGVRNFVLDEVEFTSQSNGNERVLGVYSEFIDGSIKGPFVPSQLVTDLGGLVNEYALFFDGTEKERKDYYTNKKEVDSLRTYTAEYFFEFKDSENFFDFLIPGVYVSKGALFEGQFKTQNTIQFSCFAEFDTLRYEENKFITNALDFYSSKKAFSSDVLISLIASSDLQQYSNEIETEYFQLNGSWGSAKQLNFDASIKQKQFNNRAQAYGVIDFVPEGYNLSIKEENSAIRLLENNWTFSPTNQVAFKNGEIWFRDFEIKNEKQSLAVNGIISEDKDRQVFLNVQDFNLTTLKPIYNIDIKGIANGSANLSNLRDSPIIASQLIIDALEYKGILVGDLQSEVKWDKSQQIMNTFSEVLRKEERVFTLEGEYDPKLQYNPFNLKAELRETNMNIFGTFTGGIFSKLAGFASGDIIIKGSPTDPILSGKLGIKKGELVLAATGTHLYFDDDIYLNEEGFVASQSGFTVRDALSNGATARLEGGVFNGGGGNFMLGLHAYIQDKNGFKLLDLSNKQSDVFYGKAFATGDLHLTGSFTDVLVTANLTSRANTKVTIPLDGSTSVDVEEEAIPFSPRLTMEQSLEKDEVVKKKVVSTAGLRMLFNLTLTPDAECEIIFDRQNNDQLNAFGNGRLTIEYDTRGDFTMSGPYVVTGGKYDFSFQNLASLRKFEILEGSRLTWSGDPYNAQLNMKAGYTTTFPLRDIPNLELPEGSTEAGNRYPLDVIINVQGELENPIISYDVDLKQEQVPTNYQTEVLAFEQRLKSDEQLLSRNVSSLLAFNQIFREGNALEMINQQFLIDNLNNMLSNQIGNLANKLDPNLELGVQLGDFRENLLNNLQLNFSYKFLNNRLKLSGNSSFSNGVGLNDNLATTASQGLLSVGGEVEWILSDDGMWKVKGYSRSVPNVNIISAAATGNVVVSGVNIIFSKNFNSLFPTRSKVIETKKAPNQIPIGVGRKEDDPELSLLMN